MKLRCYLTNGFGVAHPETRNSKFRRNGLNKGINQRNFKGALKAHWVDSFIKFHFYLTKGSECTPLLNRALSEWLIPKREISNVAGLSLTDGIPEGI